MSEPINTHADALPVPGRAARLPRPVRFRIRDYAVLLKPRVMGLVVFTAVVGLVLAPGAVDVWTGLVAVVAIAAGAGAAGAINMWYDRDIDGSMARTRLRPLPSGRLSPLEALVFGVVLSAGSVFTLALAVNGVAAALLGLTIFYYVVIYTVWLKRRTAQNIVIGGASGALPPVIGWACGSAEVGLGAVVLFAIIFLWTPPHSWALALFRSGDYAAAGVPMLPVVAGVGATKRRMAAYTALLIPVTLLPVVIGLSGWLYGATAVLLGIGLAHHMARLYVEDGVAAARPLFFFTIYYLFGIFAALLADNAVAAWG